MEFKVVYAGDAMSEGGFLGLRLPDAEGLAQDREWIDVYVDGAWRRIRLHDYDAMYRIPGLYETVYQRSLQTTSPARVVNLLKEMLGEAGARADDLRVLDVGAGNGMVGAELRNLGVDKVIGVDISDEARRAALRDRAWCYDVYMVVDLTEIEQEDKSILLRARLNALTCVAALGFDDIPAEAFLNAVDLIGTPGWLAFNIKEDFVQERDSSGFSNLLKELAREGVIQMEAYRRYRHRNSVDGKPLHYIAMVARKVREVPEDLRERYLGRFDPRLAAVL